MKQFAYVITLDLFSNVPLDVFESSGGIHKNQVELAGLPFRLLDEHDQERYQGLYLGTSESIHEPLRYFRQNTNCTQIEYRQESGEWLRV